MRLASSLRRREWTPVLGYALFVTLLAAGYYYNVTFVQLGLLDLGTRLVGMTRAEVSAWMAALLTFVVAVDLLGEVPILGTAVQLFLVATGLGAVLIAYYGLREFEPALSELAD